MSPRFLFRRRFGPHEDVSPNAAFRRRFLTCGTVAMALLLTCIVCGVHAETLIPVGPGLNVNGLFYGPPADVVPAQLFTKLRGLRFGWIRLPIDITPLMHGDAAQEADLKTRLPAVLAAARQAGLPVVVSPQFHPEKAPTILAEIKDPNGIATFEKILEMIASAIVADGGSNELELLNEPDECKGGEWAQDQRRLYRDMRSRYRSLPLVLTSDCWSGYQSLTQLDAAEYAKDPVAYFTFHFYQPNVFVSQDSPWAKDYTRCTHEISYPPNRRERDRIEHGCEVTLDADPKLDAGQKAKIKSTLNGALDEYFNTDWQKRINSEFQAVERWKNANHITGPRVLLTEFGVQRSENGGRRADDHSRILWIQTIVAAAAAPNAVELLGAIWRPSHR